ncbi:MAG: hypothetical protein KAT74_07555 [Candidatus Cloacimonetes bacterium]|nr:hypothetical protein [Candidatus Cloacimonadota bacterium]
MHSSEKHKLAAIVFTDLLVPYLMLWNADWVAPATEYKISTLSKEAEFM